MFNQILNYARHIDPFVQEDDIQTAVMVNEYDMFIQFKDGRKYMYDTFDESFSSFYPENYELTDDEWNSSFKTRLRNMRNRKRLSQKELADLLNVTEKTINRYENGQSIPSALMLKKISIALKCPLDEFFYKEY